METYSFGVWVQQRRKALHLTQRELASGAACAVATIKKIESDERRPSSELAQTLGEALAVPSVWRDAFIECARGQRPVDALSEVGMAGAGDTAVKVTSLPAASGLFLGREHELDEICHLLSQPECRLLTLVGPGGIGKTSLAIASARRLSESFADGAVFVPLAPVEDPAMIPSAIAQSLNITLSGAAEEQLAAYLRQQSLLLVLDNCEQLGDGVAWFSTLLVEVPGVKLLATSREAMQIAEEWLYRVPALDQPQAVALFGQVARRRESSFRLDEQAGEVTEICQLVENLPLALELAAGWTPMMSCAQIAEHIRQDIDFLAANLRNLPERHRSLRAVFDHSWALLSEAEQDALMRLSVFRGGWTTEESEPVAGATLPLLRSLVEKSLLRTASEGRYDMHELIRQYAEAKLRESGLEDETHLRHVDACKQVVARFFDRVEGILNQGAHRYFEDEIDNFRTAIAWTIDTGRWELALELLHHLFYPLLRYGYYQEGEHWHKAAQAIAPEADNYWLCQSLMSCATYTALQGRFSDASVYSKRGAVMAYRLEHPTAIMRMHELFMQAEPDLDKAREHFEQARELMKDWDHLGQPGRFIGLHWLFGDRLFQAGYRDEAAALFNFSTEAYRSSGNLDAIVYAQGNLGRIALDEGRLDEAYERISESVRISREAGVRVGIADWLLQLGYVLLYQEDLEESATAFDEALALYEEIGNRRAIMELRTCLGRVALAQGDLPLAADYLSDSLSGYRQFMRQFSSMAPEWGTPFSADVLHCVIASAQLAVAQQHNDHAVTLLAIIDFLHSRIRFGHLDPALIAQITPLTETMRDRLSESAFEAAWVKGEALQDAESMLTFALGE